MSNGWVNIEQSYFEDSLQLAAKQERERIIKLLEDEIDAGLDDDTLHYLIELIKGETNGL